MTRVPRGFVVGVVVLAASVGLSAQRGRPTRPASPGPQGPVLPGRGLPAPPAPAQSDESRPNGHLFAPQDLGLIEGPDREQWQKPDQIMDALAIAEGSVVAEIGAGGGWFTARLSSRVGPNGVVYAEDIQPLMIEAIERRVQRENLRNVKAILGSATDPRLPRGAVDAVLIVEVYREMGIAPADPVMLLRRIAESLKPGGRLGVVDYNAGGGGPGPAREQRVDPEAVIKAASAAGLHLLARDRRVNTFQFLLVFDRPVAGHGTP